MANLAKLLNVKSDVTDRPDAREIVVKTAPKARHANYDTDAQGTSSQDVGCCLGPAVLWQFFGSISGLTK